jgi:chemotaxis protein CheD
LPKTKLDVGTGEVAVAAGDAVLRANGVGSCVVVAVVDREARAGGLAHTMLPGSCPDGHRDDRLRYAADAVAELMARMAEHGADPAAVTACIAGAATCCGATTTRSAPPTSRP